MHIALYTIIIRVGLYCCVRIGQPLVPDLERSPCRGHGADAEAPPVLVDDPGLHEQPKPAARVAHADGLPQPRVVVGVVGALLAEEPVPAPAQHPRLGTGGDAAPAVRVQDPALADSAGGNAIHNGERAPVPAEAEPDGGVELEGSVCAGGAAPVEGSGHEVLRVADALPVLDHLSFLAGHADVINEYAALRTLGACRLAVAPDSDLVLPAAAEAGPRYLVPGGVLRADPALISVPVRSVWTDIRAAAAFPVLPERGI